MKKCYFLDARDLANTVVQENAGEVFGAKLDKERAEKLFPQNKFPKNKSEEAFGPANRKWGKHQAESLGAGLLLQYALQEYLAGTEAEGFIPVTLSQIMEDVRPAIFVSLRYGEKGKPYLRDIPLYFSLSHSEGRVICAVSDAEVGADLQYPRDMDMAKTVARFFAEEEKREWKELPLKKQEEFFYHLWTRKEAYGKLTGEGVGKTISLDMGKAQPENTSDTQTAVNIPNKDRNRRLEWAEYFHDGAYIAVCYEIK